MIALIDNYDSFVYNLARYLQRLGQQPLVVRNDAITVDKLREFRPDAIVLSPGPCTPNEAGCSLDIVRKLGGEMPILGICLGHQTIGVAFGGRVVRANEPVHGRTSQIFHQGGSVFAGLPSPLVACRYHSLVVERDSLPKELQATAWTADGTIMALQHRALPIVGLQFHPESILTDHGYEMLAAFLRAAGITMGPALPSLSGERPPRVAAVPLPTGPITF